MCLPSHPHPSPLPYGREGKGKQSDRHVLLGEYRRPNWASLRLFFSYEKGANVSPKVEVDSIANELYRGYSVSKSVTSV